MKQLHPFPALELQPAVAAGERRKSGRVVFDPSGASVWEWQVQTGVFERQVTDEQLRMLEAPELRIVESAPTPSLDRQWIYGSHRAKSPPQQRSPFDPNRSGRMHAARPSRLRQLWSRFVGE
jgi:hypothetical protein